jgi:hypothetical protein
MFLILLQIIELDLLNVPVAKKSTCFSGHIEVPGDTERHTKRAVFIRVCEFYSETAQVQVCLGGGRSMQLSYGSTRPNINTVRIDT